MALQNGDMSSEQLLQGHAHVWSHTLAYANSMSLKCAIQLGIPDVIYKHGKPITLSQLVEAISVDNAKSHHIDRLMRILVNSKIFIKDLDQEEARYWLTPASRLLFRKPPLTLAPLTLLMLDPIVTKTWHHMSEWLTTEGHVTQFEVAHESTFWEHAATKPSMGSLFDEAMCGDSSLVAEVLVRNYKHVFVGVKSLVDVGGGTGTMGKAIIDALPDIKCIVLDLPHVVAGMESTDKLSYVGGDMFKNV